MISLDLMRSQLPVVVLLATVFAACATTIHVEGVLVQGDRHYITGQDVEQALAALRTDSPDLRAQFLREIYVDGPSRIWFHFSSSRFGPTQAHPVERIDGHWKASHGVWT